MNKTNKTPVLKLINFEVFFENVSEDDCELLRKAFEADVCELRRNAFKTDDSTAELTYDEVNCAASVKVTFTEPLCYSDIELSNYLWFFNRIAKKAVQWYAPNSVVTDVNISIAPRR